MKSSNKCVWKYPKDPVKHLNLNLHQWKPQQQSNRHREIRLLFWILPGIKEDLHRSNERLNGSEVISLRRRDRKLAVPPAGGDTAQYFLGAMQRNWFMHLSPKDCSVVLPIDKPIQFHDKTFLFLPSSMIL